jgi:small-conductance mechanosensitive channel
VVFSIGVTYQTSAEKVRAIPAMLRDAVEAQPRTRFDRAHFKEYGDSALVYEAVYHVLDPDYNFHMDTQQAINLAILDRFTAEGIEFAYPTRTLHVVAAPTSPASTASTP